MNFRINKEFCNEVATVEIEPTFEAIAEYINKTWKNGNVLPGDISTTRQAYIKSDISGRLDVVVKDYGIIGFIDLEPGTYELEKDREIMDKINNSEYVIKTYLEGSLQYKKEDDGTIKIVGDCQAISDFYVNDIIYASCNSKTTADVTRNLISIDLYFELHTMELLFELYNQSHSMYEKYEQNELRKFLSNGNYVFTSDTTIEECKPNQTRATQEEIKAWVDHYVYVEREVY